MVVCAWAAELKGLCMIALTAPLIAAARSSSHWRLRSGLARGRLVSYRKQDVRSENNVPAARHRVWRVCHRMSMSSARTQHILDQDGFQQKLCQVKTWLAGGVGIPFHRWLCQDETWLAVTEGRQCADEDGSSSQL